MASSEFQPAPQRGPELRPDVQPIRTPEVSGHPVEAAPASANLAPTPGSAPLSGPADHSQSVATTATTRRSMVNLGRPTVKPPERADASRAVFVDQTLRVVLENKNDPAVQKDEISRTKAAYQEFKESVGA